MRTSVWFILAFILSVISQLPVSAESRNVVIEPQSVTVVIQKETGAICSGRWQGPNLGFLTNWFIGPESYLSYQDPLENNCSDAYPFAITRVRWMVTNMTGNTLVVPMQSIIHAVDAGSGSCPKPGGVMHTGQLFNVSLPFFATVVVTFNLSSPVCVNGPYFAGVKCPSMTGQGKLGINLDSAQVVPPRSCAGYIDFTGQWEDVVEEYEFPGNVILWSEGNVADSNTCQTGGNCCVSVRGNVDCDSSEMVDISDLTVLISHLFISFDPLCCMDEANIDAVSGVDISDLTALIDHLFIANPPLIACP